MATPLGSTNAWLNNQHASLSEPTKQRVLEAFLSYLKLNQFVSEKRVWQDWLDSVLDNSTISSPDYAYLWMRGDETFNANSHRQTQQLYLPIPNIHPNAEKGTCLPNVLRYPPHVNIVYHLREDQHKRDQHERDRDIEYVNNSESYDAERDLAWVRPQSGEEGEEEEPYSAERDLQWLDE